MALDLWLSPQGQGHRAGEGNQEGLAWAPGHLGSAFSSQRDLGHSPFSMLYSSSW